MLLGYVFSGKLLVLVEISYFSRRTVLGNTLLKSKYLCQYRNACFILAVELYKKTGCMVDLHV